MGGPSFQDGALAQNRGLLMMLFQRRRRYRWVERKRTRKFRWLPSLLILIGLLVGLELLARVIVNRASLDAQLAFDQSPAIVEAYQLRFTNVSGQPYATLSEGGALTAIPNPLLGYRLMPTQQTEFWTINEQGFRDSDPLPPQKPPEEIRIFVLGGSTAFGQLSSENAATFGEQLETRLNQQVAQQQANPDQFQPAVLPYRADFVEKALALPPRIRAGQYRVVNAAVPGYTSGNELAQLVQHVANYQPDFLVVLDSYADLLLPSDQTGVGVPGLEAILQNQRPAATQRLRQGLQQWFAQLSTVRLFKYYGLGQRPAGNQLTQPLNVLSTQGDTPLTHQLAPEDPELQLRVQQYRQHLAQMAHWTTGAKIPLIIALQPELSGRPTEALLPAEAAILQALGTTYPERIQTGYEQLNKAANQVAQGLDRVEVLNLYRLYENFDGQAFHSPSSLTDAANGRLAERLYGAIATRLALTPKPYGSE
jgi:hypothetical protein